MEQPGQKTTGRTPWDVLYETITSRRWTATTILVLLLLLVTLIGFAVMAWNNNYLHFDFNKPGHRSANDSYATEIQEKQAMHELELASREKRIEELTTELKNLRTELQNAKNLADKLQTKLDAQSQNALREISSLVSRMINTLGDKGKLIFVSVFIVLGIFFGFAAFVAFDREDGLGALASIILCILFFMFTAYSALAAASDVPKTNPRNDNYGMESWPPKKYTATN